MKYRGLAACVALLVAAPFACVSERDKFQPTDNSFPEASTDGQCSASVRCSRDLHAVVDGCDESVVIKSCLPDEGCFQQNCVAACEAAAGNDTSLGCEFSVPPPPYTVLSEDSCLAAIVSNAWGAPAHLELEYGGVPFDVPAATRIAHTTEKEITYDPFPGEIPPGEIAIVFLSGSGCPSGITPAVQKNTAIGETSRSKAFQIKASVPVAVHSVYPFADAMAFISSATLFLPVTSWKTEYVVTNPLGFDEGRKPTTQIVAAEDDTKVTVVSTVNIEPKMDAGVEGATAGVPHDYYLNRGEVLHFAERLELTGTRISATKKVAVTSGHECMNFPIEVAACDTTQLQLFPVRSWGHEYVAVPHLSRRSDGEPEDYYYRMVAAVDGTTLTYEPARPKEAPSTLDAANSAVFAAGGPFVVKSQDAEHPIALYAYMTGADAVSPQIDARDGDPEFTYVIAAEQYLEHYVFFVDPTYRNSNLVVIRARAEGQDFQPVTLDCSGPITDWTPVGVDGKYEFARIRLTRLFVGFGACGPGRHEIRSSGPFNVAVWGTSEAASYSYPAGMGIRTVNSVSGLIH